MKRLVLLFKMIVFFNIIAIGQKPNKDYYLVNDTTNLYPSIDNILALKEFKNKIVFVDLWGTKCSPCLKEFKFAGDLKQRFQNDSIVFLYLCSPYKLERDIANEKHWENIIYKNELKGIHFLLTNECYENGFWNKFKDKYTEDRLYGIPTYLLVDRKGSIRNYDAPRPSEKEIIYNQIQALLDE